MPTLNSFIRSAAAAQRRSEREAKRRQRELEKQQKQLARMQEFERAAYEVKVFENHIDVLMSIHKDCGPVIDWQEILSSTPPRKPKKEEFSDHESSSQAKLDAFKPSIKDKISKQTEKRRENLAKEIETSKLRDEEEYVVAMDVYESEYVDWETSRKIADGILSNDAQAFLDAIDYVKSFGEIGQLGSSLSFQMESPYLIEATLRVNSEEVIPQEAKTLLKSGKLSIKKMPKTRFYELYQDYVCACVLRIARELFALLPTDMVLLTATNDLLNTKTGHLEEHPVLSVAIPRETLDRLNFDMLDPSDSMQNFIHKMKFLKTKGFQAVERINPSQFEELNTPPSSPRLTKREILPHQFLFLGHEQLAKIRQLRKTGKLEEAEAILLKGEPSPAILDQIRMIASARAKNAKKEEDWEAVIKYLEGYSVYAEKWRDYAINMANQEPPLHTATDKKLLEMAKGKLAN